jgi:hypothetical protein
MSFRIQKKYFLLHNRYKRPSQEGAFFVLFSEENSEEERGKKKEERGKKKEERGKKKEERGKKKEERGKMKEER